VGKEIKVVFDTNVWVSAAMEKILKDEFLHVKKEITVYVNEDTILEISKVLLYPKIAEILKQTGIREKEILRIVAVNCKMVEPKVKVLMINEDADDNKILECALASNAHIIVS
jgi:putative PIN family toxin of toxin-antitoxin system